MPNNTNKVVRNVDFQHDFGNYWYGTVTSYKGMPFKIISSEPKKDGALARDYNELFVHGRVIDSANGRWKALDVSGEELSYEFPPLGFVKSNSGWMYLHRNPQRKMTKGYNNHTVIATRVSQGDGSPFDVMSESVIRQLYYGNPNRISRDCVITEEMTVYYGVEHIGTIGKDGVFNLMTNHEKMGAIVCKLLANSSVARSLVPNLQLLN